MTVSTIVCPADSRYRLVLDPSQIFPDDPGAGTPALIEGPGGVSGTFHCAYGTGEVEGVQLPDAVYRWVETAALEAVEAMEGEHV